MAEVRYGSYKNGIFVEQTSDEITGKREKQLRRSLNKTMAAALPNESQAREYMEWLMDDEHIPTTDKKRAWHFGKMEAHLLIDYIYEGKDLRK